MFKKKNIEENYEIYSCTLKFDISSNWQKAIHIAFSSLSIFKILENKNQGKGKQILQKIL